MFPTYRLVLFIPCTTHYRVVYCYIENLPKHVLHQSTPTWLATSFFVWYLPGHEIIWSLCSQKTVWLCLFFLPSAFSVSGHNNTSTSLISLIWSRRQNTRKPQTLALVLSYFLIGLKYCVSLKLVYSINKRIV